jgi:hypothetical protein
LLHNLLNNSSGYEHMAPTEHLSRHAESTKKGVQESNIGQISPARDVPEVVKLVGVVEDAKEHGQFKKSCLAVKYLDDGNTPNYSAAGIASTVEPDTEFESTSSTQFISNVAIHCEEKVQGRELCGSSHHRRFWRMALKKRALYNTGPYPNAACIRPCRVKLVRLEDVDKSRKIKNCKVSAVHSCCFRSDLLKCSSSKMSGKVCRVAGCVADEEACAMVCADSPDSEAKKKPHVASVQQEDTHFFRAEETGVASKSGTERAFVPVPAPGRLSRCRCDESKINIVKNSGNKTVRMNVTKQFSSSVIYGNIDASTGHAPIGAENGNHLNSLVSRGRHIAASKTGEKTDSEATETSVLKTEFAEVTNKTFRIQEKCGTNSVQIGHRKHSRRKIGKGKEPTSSKLRKYKLPDQLKLLNKMKAVSISLERLSQSVLEKRSAASASVSCRSVPCKGAQSTEQEAAENAGSCSGAYCKHITSSGNVKCVHYRDRIPSLDGVDETSSSDDSSESTSVDHVKELENSPVRRPEEKMKIIHTFEDKLTDPHHWDASYVTSPRKPGSGTPSENMKWVNTASSAPSRSRRALYPPLPIRTQKSPRKRTVTMEGKSQEKASPISELMKPSSLPSSRLGGEGTEHTFASVHSEDTSLQPTAGTPCSVCLDARTPEGQLNICAEKHMYVVSTFCS